MTQRSHPLSLCLAFLSAMFGVVLFADPAFAQAIGSVGSFSCSGGKAVGTMYDSGTSCPTAMNFQNIFSFLVCNMEQLSSNLLGNMYCGMITAMIPAVTAVLTLSVVIFGLAFTIGVIPATARDFQLFLIKIAFVYTFATQADFLIGIGYRFLVGGVQSGVAVALTAYFPKSGGGTPADLYRMLDGFLAQAIHYAVDYMKATNVADSCKNAIFSVIAVMAVAFPMMSYLALLIIAKIALTFLRSVFAYIYALVGIAFLLTLAPFFLSFFLFRQTRPLFDKWVGYMVSFTLQIILLFTFLVFVLSIDISSITSSFTDIIMPLQQSPAGATFVLPWKYCTICEFKAVDKTTGAEINPNDYKGFIQTAKLICKDNPPKPIPITAAVSPQGGAGTPPDKAVINSLLKFTFAGLMSLFILAYVVDTLLRYIPSIAQSLGGGLGAAYAPQLGGGQSPRGVATTDIPLLGDDQGHRGHGGFLNEFADGFQRGYVTGTVTPDAFIRGVTAGAEQAMLGQAVGQGRRQGGLGQSFMDWLSNPHH